jgi:hypothetical protein
VFIGIPFGSNSKPRAVYSKHSLDGFNRSLTECSVYRRDLSRLRVDSRRDVMDSKAGSHLVHSQVNGQGLRPTS